MVDDIHEAVGGGSRGAVEGAFVEGRICGIVRGFEEVGEFGEDVGDAGSVSAVVCREVFWVSWLAACWVDG